MHGDLEVVWKSDHESARIQQHIDSVNGIPVEFVFQLEYNHGDTPRLLNKPDWCPVVRFDHEHNGTHDIRYEGIHLDVYRDGHKHAQVFEKFPDGSDIVHPSEDPGKGDIPLTETPEFCYSYLCENKAYLLERYERWHDCGQRWRRQSSSTIS